MTKDVTGLVIEAWQFNPLGPSELAPGWVMSLFHPPTGTLAGIQYDGGNAYWLMGNEHCRRKELPYPLIVVESKNRKLFVYSTDWIVLLRGTIVVMSNEEFQTLTA